MRRFLRWAAVLVVETYAGKVLTVGGLFAVVAIAGSFFASFPPYFGPAAGMVSLLCVVLGFVLLWQGRAPTEVAAISTVQFADQPKRVRILIEPVIMSRRIDADHNAPPPRGYSRVNSRDGSEGGSFALLSIKNDANGPNPQGVLATLLVDVFDSEWKKRLFQYQLRPPWLLGGHEGKYVPYITDFESLPLKEHEAHFVGIAVRYPALEDDECYMLTRQSLHWRDWLFSENRLRGRKFKLLVTVGIRGGSVKWRLELINHGKGGGLEWFDWGREGK